MKAYSLDLRQKIVNAYDAGGISQRNLAERFCVSVFFVKKLFRQRTKTGSIAPKARTGWQKARVTPEIRQFVIALHKQENDRTLAEAAARVADKFGVTLSQSTICRICTAADLRRKKS